MVDPIVFVGAGLASITAIESLREKGVDAPFVLLSAEGHLPYDRPPLSKDVLLGQSLGGVPLRGEDFYEDMAVDLHLDTGVAAIDPVKLQVHDERGGCIRADRIVLGTGGSPRRLSVPGGGLEGVFTLRTLDDALALDAALYPGVRVAVIGGGFIGTEVAAAAVQRGAQVTLLEALPQPLHRVLPEFAPHLADHHRARGVDIRVEAQVEALTGTQRVTGVRLAGGKEIAADLVVAGIGMVPNEGLALQAGLAAGGGIHVDADGRTSHERIHAIGDVAAVDDGSGQRRRSEHWQGALHAGRRLAAAISGGATEPEELPWFWSDQYDVNVQIVGWIAASDDRVLRGDPALGPATALFHRGGRLTGAVMLNAGREVRPVKDLISGGIHVDPGVLGDPDTSLRRLAKAHRRAPAMQAT